MISVSTDNYFTMLRAAQLQAVRDGIPGDSQQSVPVAIEERAPPPAPQTAIATIKQVVDVLV
ncbi:hypothetical protein MMSR116_29430 [Methylobacterium mesophilicum SR1.6/6]|uniref:Uncharacterized protein n=1 Tax=Methylobacterium mesophilicum SR1.6/6 TaxID=908290 RepID=A0A6B9FUK8_9HYPH|nr:hypothetical protein [Methylobacterium mesophilicum]QGY05559.1 hypothetical protein MMSR116_29430 [Methylobacterium mesophilicum SR1.6/6]